MPFQPGNQSGATAKRKPNRIKRDAREAIARFVDGNAHKLQRWLKPPSQTVSERLTSLWKMARSYRASGSCIPTRSGRSSCFQSVIEYHVPKLSKTRDRQGSARRWPRHRQFTAYLPSNASSCAR